jgi:hypothetical protein
MYGFVDRPCVIMVRGMIRNSSLASNILLVGCKEAVHSFARDTCSRIDSVNFLGRVFYWQTDPSSSLPSELAGVCTPKWYAEKLTKSGYFVLPMVTFSLDLNKSVEEIVKSTSRRRRRDINRLAKYGYSYSVSTKNARDLSYFYHKMYVPYAKTRFQDSAYVTSYLKSLNEYDRNGGLVFVRKGEKPIAGILFHMEKRKIYAVALGICGGNYEYVRDLAGQAALFFLIKWAKNQGFEKLHYGNTMPFLKDGIFTYKKEWGMTIEEGSNPYYYALKIVKVNERTLSFLQQNPFVFLDRGQMKGLAFIIHNKDEREMTEIFSDYEFRGINSVIVVDCYTYYNTEEIYCNTSRGAQNIARNLPRSLSEICGALEEQGFNVVVRELDRNVPCTGAN